MPTTVRTTPATSSVRSDHSGALPESLRPPWESESLSRSPERVRPAIVARAGHAHDAYALCIVLVAFQ